jgi:hypothetical protein
LGFFERSCISVLLLYSVVYVALYVINERAINGSSWQKSISVAMSTSSAITFALAFVAYVMRWFAIHRAWNLVIADKERYDSMWQSIIHSPNSAEWLTALQDEVSKSSLPAEFTTLTFPFKIFNPENCCSCCCRFASLPKFSLVAALSI